MNDYSELQKRISELKKYRASLDNSFIDEIDRVEGELKQLCAYYDFAILNLQLKDLYEARRKADNSIEALEADRNLYDFFNKYGSLLSKQERNRIRKMNPDEYKKLNSEFKVSVTSFEAFKKQISKRDAKRREKLMLDQFEYTNSIDEAIKEFERRNGIKFDPDKITYEFDGVDGTLDDDNMSYMKYTFLKKSPSVSLDPIPTPEPTPEPKPEDEYEYVEIFKDEYAEGLPSKEQLFEQKTGIKFDPNKHKILDEGAETVSIAYGDGDQVEPFVVVEKRLKAKASNTDDQDKDKDKKDQQPTGDNNQTKDQNTDDQDKDKNKKDDKKDNTDLNSKYSNLTDEEIERRINELWNTAMISGEVEENDPTEVEFHELLSERDKRQAAQAKKDDPKAKRDEYLKNKYAKWSDDEINNRINELWNLAITSGEVGENDPIEVEYHELVDELDRRKRAKNDQKAQADAQKPKVLFEGEYGPGMPTPEQEFERVTGIKFDPNKHEIQYDGESGEISDDGTILPYRIVEKQQKKDLPPKEPEKDPKEPKKDPPKEPEKDPKKTKEPEIKPTKKDEDRNYFTIINEILYDGKPEDLMKGKAAYDKDKVIDLKIKNIKNFKEGDVPLHTRIASVFRNRVRQGNKNYIYTTTGVLTAGPNAIVATIKNVKSGIYTWLHSIGKNNRKARYDRVVNKLNQLSDKDMEILIRDYKPDKVAQNRGYEAVNGLICDRICQYIQTKYIDPRQAELLKLKEEAVSRYEKLIELRTKHPNSQEELNQLNAAVQHLTAGGADLIRRITELQDEVQSYYGGSFSKYSTRGNEILSSNHSYDFGRGLSKSRSTGQSFEFNMQQEKFTRGINEGIRTNDDIKALESYCSLERIRIAATKEKTGLLGKRSVGDYNWTELPVEGNYAADPLLQYVFSAVTQAALVYGFINNSHNMDLRDDIKSANSKNSGAQAQIDQGNAQNSFASAQNEAQMREIHDIGAKLEGRATDYKAGVEQMTQDSIVGRRTAEEYLNADAHNWHTGGDAWKQYDEASHEAARMAYESFDAQVKSLNKGLTSGSMSPVEVLQGLNQALGTCNAAKATAYQEFLDVMKNYCANHPQYDYGALEACMREVTSNPDVIGNMVDGMVYSVEAGQTLQQAAASAYTSISTQLATIPSDIRNLAFPLITETALLGYLDRKTELCNKFNRASKLKERYQKINASEQQRLMELQKQQEEARKAANAEEMNSGRSR